ncbi:MAG: HEAT repeat domain-containing protein [Polyangiaceae bacterium]|nr:HEAT repeat domain-containing protein [Polyangiaceae bacterium]
MSLSRLVVIVSIAGLSSGCSELGSLLRTSSAEDTKEASGPPKLYEHLDDLSKFDCTTLREMVVAARKDYFNDDNINENHLEEDKYGNVVGALAKCAESKMIFEDIARLGGPGPDSFGTGILIIGDKRTSGLVFDVFEAYAKANTGPAFLASPGGRYAADHVAFWLLKADHKDQCDMIDTVTTGSDYNIRRQFNEYFVEANCKQAMPILVERLSNKDPDVRHLACARLGQIGDKSVLDELDAVANGDNAVHLVERYSDGQYERTPDGRLATKHFVADMCATAASLIRAREKGR